MSWNVLKLHCPSFDLLFCIALPFPEFTWLNSHLKGFIFFSYLTVQTAPTLLTPSFTPLWGGSTIWAAFLLYRHWNNSVFLSLLSMFRSDSLYTVSLCSRIDSAVRQGNSNWRRKWDLNIFKTSPSVIRELFTWRSGKLESN